MYMMTDRTGRDGMVAWPDADTKVHYISSDMEELQMRSNENQLHNVTT